MRPPIRPLRINHLGYYTGNARKTVEFWTQVMRCKFTSSIWNPELPSTRQPYPYLHIFFELGDGSTVAFFEIPDVGEEAPPAEPLRTINHLAMHLDSVEDVYAWKEWLESKGIAVIGPVDHQVILSIYFFDPTSNCRLELTTPLTRVSDQDAKDAEKALDQWEMWRDEAAVVNLSFGDFLRQKLQMRAKHVA
ncbi:MAG: VOC family protein [Deltaproteobacteria bacterium]|nr:VOC family protein [Deltaproteobacteria bacterium]